MKETLDVAVIGKGNVGAHLYKALSGANRELTNINVTLVDSRTLDNLPEHSDIILIAVKDDAIAEVASCLKGKADIIAHTSGSVSINVLKDYASKYGVFYPLQTFSKDKELIYKDIPFFIEGSDPQTFEQLRQLALLVSPHVYEADSAGRKRLHIAAVFACNFSNHLVAIADELLKEDGMDYKVLMPLLRETVGKLDSLSPRVAQTGPAVRNDRTVMEAHEDMLSTRPEWQTIYRLLSSSIGHSR